MVKCTYTSFWIQEKEGNQDDLQVRACAICQAQPGFTSKTGLTMSISTEHKWRHGVTLQGYQPIPKGFYCIKSQKNASLPMWPILLSRKTTVSHKLYKHCSLLHQQCKHFCNPHSLTNVSYHKTVSPLHTNLQVANFQRCEYAFACPITCEYAFECPMT